MRRTGHIGPHYSRSSRGYSINPPPAPEIEVVMLGGYKEDGRSRTGPRSKIFQGFWDVYHGSFPKDESEPRRTWEGVVKNPHTIRSKDLYVEDHAMAALRRGRVVGMATGAFIDGDPADRSSILGPMLYGSYMAVRKGSRNSGVAYALYDAAKIFGKEMAQRRGSDRVDWIVCETDDPRVSQNVAMDPNQRLIFLDNLGFMAVDPAKFEYKQPQLTQETEPCPGLFWCINTPDSRISSEKLLTALRRWVPGQFEALPGMEGEYGRYTRNPDKDPTFQYMERQLECVHDLRLVDLKKFMVRK